jgi:oxygen-dependent protoporphyrinogen oxidase
MKRVVIAGAGIAGLSIAWALKQRQPDIDIVVLERRARTGGNIQTDRVDGYTCEAGPDGFLDNAPATLELIGQIGLCPRLLPSNDAARRRYIVHRGRLCEVPSSIDGYLRTPLLSARGKLRLALEPFANRAPGAEESIEEFARRRIGREATAMFVEPMVSGVFAGDASALSLRACFPRLSRLEADHGGLLRGLLATRRSRQRAAPIGTPAGRLTSFEGGLAELTDALTERLGAAVRTSTPVVGLAERPQIRFDRQRSPATHYAVGTPGGAVAADAVVLSGPARETAAILQRFDPGIAKQLEGIATAPLAVVCLGFNSQAIIRRGTLDGFGFLVPRHEGIRILGALWETSIYRHRGPAGKMLLRVMIGGALDPDAVKLSDGELLDVVRKDLARVMGLSDSPEFVRIVRHAGGIPQYVKGHLARIHQIETLLQAHPGLYLAGSSYRGVSINSCIAEAGSIADRVLRSIAA